MMRGRPRQKLLRILISALMDSDLTLQELRSIEVELNDGDVARELAYMLRMLNKHISIYDSPRGTSGDPHLEQQIFDAAKKRRISKNSLLNLVIEMSPSIEGEVDIDMSVREIISTFVSSNTERKSTELLNLLDIGSSAGDPYLNKLLQRTQPK